MPGAARSPRASARTRCGGPGRPRRWREIRVRWRDLAEGWKAPSASGAARGLVDNRFYKPHRRRPRTPACHAVASGPAPQPARRATPSSLPSPLLPPFRTSAAFERARAGPCPGCRWRCRYSASMRVRGRPGWRHRTAPVARADSRAPRGDAAKRLPIILRARELRGRPDLETIAEGDAELRRGGIVIRADRLSYDQAEDLARAIGNVRISQRRQRLQRPRTAAEGAALRGLLPRARPTGSRRTGAGGQADASTSSTTSAPSRPTRPTRAASAGRLGRRPPGCCRRAACGSTRKPTRASPGRRAALLRRADPGGAVDQLPADRRAQVGLAAADHRLDNNSGFEVGGAVLLEHRAEPRRHLHADRHAIAAARPRHRVPLPRAALQRRIDARPAAVRPVGASARAMRCGSFTTAAFDRRHAAPAPPACASPTTTTGRTSRATSRSLTPRLLRDRPALQPAVRLTGRRTRRVQRWQVLQTVDPSTRIEAPYERVAADRVALLRQIRPPASS